MISVIIFRNIKIRLVQYKYTKPYDIWNVLFQRCGFHIAVCYFLCLSSDCSGFPNSVSAGGKIVFSRQPA